MGKEGTLSGWQCVSVAGSLCVCWLLCWAGDGTAMCRSVCMRMEKRAVGHVRNKEAMLVTWAVHGWQHVNVVCWLKSSLGRGRTSWTFREGHVRAQGTWAVSRGLLELVNCVHIETDRG